MNQQTSVHFFNFNHLPTDNEYAYGHSKFLTIINISQIHLLKLNGNKFTFNAEIINFPIHLFVFVYFVIAK